MSVSDIVQVNVNLASSSVQQPGFGVPLILGGSAALAHLGSDLLRYYSGASALSAMVTDGFATTDPEYLAAGKLVAQNPSVQQFAVGKRTHLPTQVTTITPTAVDNTVYTMTVKGQTVSFTSGSSTTPTLICTGLNAAITALGLSGVTNTGTTTVILTATTAGAWFQASVGNRSLLSLAQTNADGGIGTDLAAIAVADGSGWYAFMSVFAGAAEITAASTWAAGNGKRFIQQTQDSQCAQHALSGATDIMAAQQTATAAYCALLFGNDNSDFKDAGWLGRCLPLAPGSETWANKTLANCATDSLTQTEQNNIRAKNGNFYTTFAGAGMTQGGMFANADFIDQSRGKDWYASRVQTRILSLLNRVSKVPYTDPGIASIVAELSGQNDEAVDVGLFSKSPAPTVFYPKASSVSSSDRTARKLQNIGTTATLAGAIHSTIFNINLSV